MKEWQVRQKIFHKIFQHEDLGDDFSKMKIVEEWDEEAIVQRALEYPVKQVAVFSYPAKSYAIGVTFAKLLQINFGEDFLTALNDPALLYKNDPYFKTYLEEKKIYDKIIEGFPWSLLENPSKASSNYQKPLIIFIGNFFSMTTQKYTPLLKNH